MNHNIRLLIPNLFTACSLISALVALHFIYEANYILASWLVAVSMFFDGFDGKIARMLGACSNFGAILDTLSDFVAFGVVPAFLAYKISLHHYQILGVIICFFYVFSGGYRLVRFTLHNNSIAGKQPFTGLPIPAAAGFVASFIILNYYVWHEMFLNEILLVVLFISSVLMISKIEYLPIEKKKKLTKEARFFIVLAIFSGFLAIKFSYFVFVGWIVIYILYGLIRQLIIHAKN